MFDIFLFFYNAFYCFFTDFFYKLLKRKKENRIALCMMALTFEFFITIMHVWITNTSHDYVSVFKPYVDNLLIDNCD